MATVSYTKIYSNDGSTVLFTSSQSYATGNGASATVTETGVTFPSETYTYSGNKKFLGISSSANATTPKYAIGDAFTLGVESGSLYVVEEEAKEYTLRIDGVEVTDYENVIVNGVSYKCKKGASVPTDLTGYTITVPAGWSANSNYGIFNINGYIEYHDNNTIYRTYNYSQFAIGYDVGIDISKIDTLSIVTGSGTKVFSTTGLSFIIEIYGGTDVTKPELIQWFADMGATFTKPKLITFTIDGTQYSAEEGMTWGEWVNSSYNTDKYEEHPNLPDTVRKWSGDYNVCYIDESGVSLTAPIIASYSYITIYVNSCGGAN